MQQSGGFLKRPAQRRENIPGVTHEITNNKVVTLKGLGPEVSTVEPSTRKVYSAPAAQRGTLFPITGAALVCAIAGIWFFLHRSPVAAGGITAAASGISADSATISWTTSEPSTSQVAYGTTPAHGILSAFNSSTVTAHSVTLTGLTQATTYNYSALSANAAGQVSASGNFTFTTRGTTQGTAQGAAGPGVMGKVTVAGVTTDSAAITWTTNQPLTSQVSYGATTTYGLLSAFDAAAVTSHSVNLTGLAPGTTYNFASLSANSDGHIIQSPNFTFTTASVAGIPAISKVNVSNMTANSAIVNWTTDQPSSAQVEFGTSTAYGSLSAFNASLVTSHSVTVGGLTPGTIYEAMALSANSAGQVGKSADLTFTTLAAPPVISQVTVSALTATSAKVDWTTDQPSTSKLDYGTTTAYGSSIGANPSLALSHSVSLRGLTPGTGYDYAATSTNAAGMQNSSPNLKFTTPAR